MAPLKKLAKAGKIYKTAWHLKGGPWDGKIVWLESQNTLPLEFGKKFGRYVQRVMGNTLEWERL